MSKPTTKLRNEQSDLTSLRDRLLADIEDINAKLVEMNERKRTLEREVLELDWLIHDAELRPDALLGTTGKITRKNIDLHRAWGAVLRLFENTSSDRALTNRQLHDEVQKFLPAIKDGTFRFYLHRFQKDGLLVNCGKGRWKLAANKMKENN